MDEYDEVVVGARDKSVRRGVHSPVDVHHVKKTIALGTRVRSN